MKEIGAIFVVSISEIRTVQLAAIKRRYRPHKENKSISSFYLFSLHVGKCGKMESTFIQQQIQEIFTTNF